MATLRSIGQALEDARQAAIAKTVDAAEALTRRRKSTPAANAATAPVTPSAPAPKDDAIQNGIDAIKNNRNRLENLDYRKGGVAMSKARAKGVADSEDMKELAFMRRNKAPKAMMAAEQAEEPGYKCGGTVRKSGGGMVRRGYGKARGA